MRIRLLPYAYQIILLKTTMNGILFRRGIWLAAACVAGIAFAGCGKRCPVKADREVVEIGRVTDNSNVFFSFFLVNEGREEVQVKRIHSSLSGVAVQRQIDRIAAGDTVEIPMVVLANALDGRFSVKVDIEVEGKQQPRPVLVEGIVEKTPPTISERCTIPLGNLFLEKREVNLGRVPLNKMVRDTLLVYNPTGERQEVRVACFSESLRCRLLDREIKPGKAAFLEVSVLVKDMKLLGKYAENAVLQIGSSTRPQGVLMVRADVVEDFEGLSGEEKEKAPVVKVDSAKFNFGKIKAGTDVPHSFVVRNEGKRDLIIRKVQASCGCTAVVGEGKVVPPGKSTTVDIVYKSSGRHGVQQKSIVFFCNDPAHPEVKLWVTGEVE